MLYQSYISSVSKKCLLCLVRIHRIRVQRPFPHFRIDIFSFIERIQRLSLFPALPDLPVELLVLIPFF